MVSTQQRKRIIMVLLFILGVWGISITRNIAAIVINFKIWVLDVGTIIGIAAFIALYWKWRGLE